jgi:ribulose-bisphosphate carboxylase small chain
MRLTQGTFSFLPDLTDEQIAAQIRYALRHEWAISVEYTDDPHPRNPFWEMWGHPQFDLGEDDVEQALREVRACREAFPEHYVKVTAYDPSYTRQTTALSFIVNRPTDEPGFRLDRTESHDRVVRYSFVPYAAADPVGRRYGRNGAGTAEP